MAANSGVYLRDRQAQVTIPIPRPAIMPADDYDACYASSVSSVGTVLLECGFDNGTSTYSQVFLFVPGAGAPVAISTNAADQPGNQVSGYSLAVNASGLSMAWESRASDLVSGDTNGVSDIFVLVDGSVVSGLFSDSFED